MRSAIEMSCLSLQRIGWTVSVHEVVEAAAAAVGWMDY
jgi:hypothetical protein